MDIAYDHIQEEAFSPSSPSEKPQQSNNDSTNTDQPPQSPTLNTEVQQAFKAVTSSQWGNTIGGWFSTARKQGETLYQDLQKEAVEAQEQATKGFSSLREQVVNRTRSLSLGTAEPGPQIEVPGEEAVPAVKHTRTVSGASGAAQAEAQALEGAGEKPESLPADIVKEAGTLVASLRSTAASRLKELQKAEDAADEALLKFGTNVRNFLRDAVTISAPTEDSAVKSEDAELLFETQEPGTGKKIFHSTRLDAQLHAIHTTASSFTDEPAEGEQWDDWTQTFDIDSKTEDIAKDVERYEELRRAMEKLVPEKVEYKAFWMRYYLLRKAIEEEEKRRREVLKGAATNPEEEVAWDDDDEEEDPSTPSRNPAGNKAASESTTTLNAPTTNGSLKPKSPRRSHEDESKSVADSDASYDIVSGATSRATGSPKEEKKDIGKEESDDDWE